MVKKRPLVFFFFFARVQEHHMLDAFFSQLLPSFACNGTQPSQLAGQRWE